MKFIIHSPNFGFSTLSTTLKVYESENDGQSRMTPLEGGDQDIGYSQWSL